jgi:hypothetical protein
MQPHCISTNVKAQPIYSGVRIVGEVKGETFYKSIFGSKHILQKPRAICSDDAALQDARRFGAVVMEIRDRETGNIYSATIEEFTKHGFYIERRAGCQTCLPIPRWKIIGPDGRTLQVVRAEPAPVNQLALGI